MELYTSLVRLKQVMNDGQLPPMSPIPAPALTLIDPQFTPGLGALEENESLGLRCPVRGCGDFRHVLARHLNTAHADVGGEDAVRRALEIPATVRLVSFASRTRFRQATERRKERGELLPKLALGRARMTGERKARANASYSMNARNLRNRCEAQMRHRLIDLQNKIGRSPSSSEARVLIGDGFVSSVLAVYGTWNAAKAQFGLDACKTGRRVLIEREQVLEALRAYYAVNGALPTQLQASRPSRAPLIPAVPTINRAMGTQSWAESMRRAASLLNIYGGRYGLPESVRPVAA